MKRKVAKKLRKSAKKPARASTFMDRLPKNHGEWLELVIRLTEKGGGQTMQEQAIRLRAELAAWKAANP